MFQHRYPVVKIISAPARLRGPWHHCFLLHSLPQGWRIQRGKPGPLESGRRTILERVCAYDQRQQTCNPALLLAGCHVNLVSKHACQCWHTSFQHRLLPPRFQLAGENEFLSPLPILFASLLLGETGAHERGEAWQPMSSK